MDYLNLLLEAEKIALEAGHEIMKYYHADDNAQQVKSDGTKVTDADFASEKIILESLRNLTPHIPILSEENVEQEIMPDISDGIFWVVDPLDGTRDFIEKLDGFGVALALMVDKKPVLGVVNQPGLGWMYSACGIRTASKVDVKGNRYRLEPGKTLNRHLISPFYADIEQVEKFLLKKFGGVEGIEKASGIFRGCQVAEGSASSSIVYLNMHDGRSSWWDVAPCQAIVEAVGGSVQDFDGDDLVYDASDMRVPPHILLAP